MSAHYSNLIKALVELSSHDWRCTAMRMAWAYRKQLGLDEMPAIVQAHCQYPPEPRTWKTLRKTVGNRRRIALANARNADADSGRKLRSDYMRNYMRAYRARTKVDVA